ncbi:hypothetical protein CSW60_17065 [Caulobacter sp. X]|jgi:hypothetical protein|nr:hypothetical protein CSW60_17065 [Caulobacter sp. X]
MTIQAANILGHAMDTYTFVCLADNQVATAVDVQALSPDAYVAHAWGLLREHASAVSVEVWRDDAVLAVIERDGARMLSSTISSDEHAPEA